MTLAEENAAVPRRSRRLEVLPLPEGGAEVVVDRTRRTRLTPDALWLLEQLDGTRNVADVARLLSERFAKPVSGRDAAEVLGRTLVAHGLVTLEAPGTPAPPEAAPLVRAGRGTLAGAPIVRVWARRLAPLTGGAAGGLLVALALGALALSAARIGSAAGAGWRDPLGWALALPLLLASVAAHELAHAAALARAGGSPGAITWIASRGRLRVATDLPGARELPRRDRIRVDVAGAAAQLVVAAAAAAPALAGGAVPPAPALALTVVLALGELLPLPGSDGAWLLDDLANRDPGDTVVRAVGPARWFSRWLVRRARRRLVRQGLADPSTPVRVLPVLVSASFPDWPAAKLRALALRHVESSGVAHADHVAIGAGASPDTVRGLRPLRALRSEGRGAVVCGMHVGPFQYVPVALVDLGCRVATYAASSTRGRYAGGWQEAARRRGGSIEVLSPVAPRDAVRAVRCVREGGMLYVLMDGQVATSRDQHRADFRFMGCEVSLRTGAARLARKAGVSLVLAATRYAGVARRTIEFSDPLPPPEDDSDEAVAARMAEMLAWFESRFATVPEQWDGWIWPVAHWRATGRAPTASAAELEAGLARAREALAGGRASPRLLAEPTRVNWWAAGGEHLVVHGATRRVLMATPLTCALLDAAFRRTRARDLPARTGAGAEALAPEIARLVLAGLATLEP